MSTTDCSKKQTDKYMVMFKGELKREKVLKMTDDDALKWSLNECVEWRMLPLRDDYFGI